MAREDYWRLAGVPIDGHAGAESVHTYGESYSLAVELTATSDSDSGAWPGYVDRYRDLREYRPHAGDFVTYEPLSGGVMYREQHQQTPSLLVGLEPPADTRTGVGMWALVSAVEDGTTLPSRICELDFELTYLADYDEYASRADAQAALEATGPG